MGEIYFKAKCLPGKKKQPYKQTGHLLATMFTWDFGRSGRAVVQILTDFFVPSGLQQWVALCGATWEDEGMGT